MWSVWSVQRTSRKAYFLGHQELYFGVQRNQKQADALAPTEAGWAVRPLVANRRGAGFVDDVPRLRAAAASPFLQHRPPPYRTPFFPPASRVRRWLGARLDVRRPGRLVYYSLQLRHRRFLQEGFEQFPGDHDFVPRAHRRGGD
jgi:hypothetical protein